MQLPAGNTSTYLMLALLVMMIVVLMRRSYRYFSPRRRDRSTLVHTPRPGRVDRTHYPDAPPEVLRWEVQMQETARELSAALDNKIRILQAVIAEADRAAGRLEAAARAAGEPAPTEPAPQPPPDSLPLDAAAADSPDMQQRREEIYTLADYGFPTSDIASRTGALIGEVELILNLRAKKRP